MLIHGRSWQNVFHWLTHAKTDAKPSFLYLKLAAFDDASNRVSRLASLQLAKLIPPVRQSGVKRSPD